MNMRDVLWAALVVNFTLVIVSGQLSEVLADELFGVQRDIWSEANRPEIAEKIEIVMSSMRRETDTASIAVFSGHDASIAVGIGGHVQCVLELERLFEERYCRIEADADHFEERWMLALQTVRDRCECGSNTCPKDFDLGILVPQMYYDESGNPLFAQLPSFVEQVFHVAHWRRVDHHESHAALGFFSSPFKSALVLSIDAGGNDGAFSAYMGKSSQVTRLARLNLNFGAAYNNLAMLVQEVSGTIAEDVCKSWLSTFDAEGSDKSVLQLPPITVQNLLTWAGKMMGYAATGQIDPTIVPAIRDAFMRSSFSDGDSGRLPILSAEVLPKSCLSVEGQRNVSATVQYVFQTLVLDMVRRLLQAIGGKTRVDGVVLTGGCALNVLANQYVEDTLDIPVFVPVSPNDGGLTVGALWSVTPPSVSAPLQYLGFRMWDLEILEQEAKQRGAVKIHHADDLIHSILATDASGERSITAIVRGRQEFGPRALGHRSLVAFPDSPTIKDKLNRLKARQWYRPVAPMIAVEALTQVFGRSVPSPYMEKAPTVTDATLQKFPGLAHLDKTARHQSVSAKDEPWLHALLTSIGKKTGLAALINTSFNTKGKPLVNRIKECLHMLDSLPDLDFVLIEDWLFAKSSL